MRGVGAAASPPSLRRRLAWLFVLSGLVVVAAAIAAAISMVSLTDDKHDLVHRIDPAKLLVSEMLAGYLDQETGVRGYVLTGQTLFLQPYDSGQATETTADAQLGRLVAGQRSAEQKLVVIRARAFAWQNVYARPAVAAVARGDHTFASPTELTAGQKLFDSLRSSVTSMQSELTAESRTATSDLSGSTEQLVIVLIVSLFVILLDGAVIWAALRRLVISPLAEVAVDTRTVTSGDLSHTVGRNGSREIAALAADIEAMRMKIVAEVTEARRSNEDLEQFAYVASHDLQEPLRKIISFCELLEKRYGGQLDDRADQYIAFAVDGAKRMQVLINDLLAFSRIGRTAETFGPVDLATSVESALRNLSRAVEDADASVLVEGDLPTVKGDRTLLGTLMQNLIANALKFRGADRPEVRIAATASDDEWILSVTDNGIGIEARFAERIFVIFQRLHSRESYTGTGIGLALCRKIVEFHGGRIWLDVDYLPGTRFCFTLPQIPPEEGADELGHAAVGTG